jgi:hypothetical protein
VFRFRLTQDHPDEIFRKAVLLSLLLHLALWAGFALKHFFGDGLRETIEIDLTQPFRVGGNPLLKTGGGDREVLEREPGQQRQVQEQRQQDGFAEDFVGMVLRQAEAEHGGDPVQRRGP